MCRGECLSFQGLELSARLRSPLWQMFAFFQAWNFQTLSHKTRTILLCFFVSPCLVVLPLWLSWETWVSQCSKMFFKNCVILKQSRIDIFLVKNFPWSIFLSIFSWFWSTVIFVKDSPLFYSLLFLNTFIFMIKIILTEREIITAFKKAFWKTMTLK